MKVRGLAVDAGVVAVLVAATLAYRRWPDELEVAKLYGLAGGEAAWRRELAWWFGATAVGLAAMLVCSRFPLVALAGSSAMVLVHATAVAVPFLPVDLAPLAALYTVAAGAGRRWVSCAALAASVGLAFAPARLAPRELPGPWDSSLLPLIAVALAWLAGDRTRTRRAYLEQATERAQALERERDQQAELAAAAERARIARELHDAVAHGLSIIVIQAQAAAGAMDRRPGTARTALAAIVATGRDSLAEMRRLLGLTRPDGPELAPLPGLTELPALVERVRAAGLPIRTNVTGDPAAVPTGVGLSGYRIVQEALTNALKHAGPAATVHIDVHCGTDAVELSVADTGRGSGGQPDERRGNGLHGMRERVAMLGGTLAVGDDPDGGFRIRARLPVSRPVGPPPGGPTGDPAPTTTPAGGGR